MTIGWDRVMKPYEKPKEIPSTQIAVKAEIFEEEENANNFRGRMLDEEKSKPVIHQEIWLKREEKKSYDKMLLLRALEV